MLDVDGIKRARAKNDDRKKSRTMSIKYFLCSEGNKLQVCQASFCSALCKYIHTLLSVQGYNQYIKLLKTKVTIQSPIGL